MLLNSENPGLDSHNREMMQGRKPQEPTCSKVPSVPAGLHWDQPLNVVQVDTAISRVPWRGCPDLTAFLLKTKASLHQIIVTKKWKCTTGWQCFAVFSPVLSPLVTLFYSHHWVIRIINLPKWTALLILLFQPIAYYFIWIKIWIFTALRVLLIFLQFETTSAGQGSPYHIPVSPFPNIALRNPAVAKIRKPWCAMVFRGIVSNHFSSFSTIHLGKT